MPKHIDHKIWEAYWQERRNHLKLPDGKLSTVDLAETILLTDLLETKPCQVTEFGCGEGYLLESIRQRVQHLKQVSYLGVDRSERALASARDQHQNIDFSSYDFAKNLTGMPKFNLGIIVNALHEVVSDCKVSCAGAVDFKRGKQKANQALKLITKYAKPGAYLLLYDGIELCPTFNHMVQFRTRSKAARKLFEKFKTEYKAVEATSYSQENEVITIPYSYFQKFITKLPFINALTWEIEKYESYQYYTSSEFKETLTDLGWRVLNSDLSISHLPLWKKSVEILDQNQFPPEHILILSKLTLDK